MVEGALMEILIVQGGEWQREGQKSTKYIVKYISLTPMGGRSRVCATMNLHILLVHLLALIGANVAYVLVLFMLIGPKQTRANLGFDPEDWAKWMGVTTSRTPATPSPCSPFAVAWVISLWTGWQVVIWNALSTNDIAAFVGLAVTAAFTIVIFTRNEYIRRRHATQAPRATSL